MFIYVDANAHTPPPPPHANHTYMCLLERTLRICLNKEKCKVTVLTLSLILYVHTGIRENYAQLGMETEPKIFLAGDSAGGNLAAALTLKVKTKIRIPMRSYAHAHTGNIAEDISRG